MLAFVLLAAFVAIERRSKAPLIRLGIFRMRSLSGSNVAMLLVASGLFAMFYFASLYMQEILGYGPLKAGVAFVPFTLGIIVGAGASQALIRHIGIRIVVFAGITMGTAGLLYFARLPTHGSYVPDLLPTIAIVSIGMGMTFVPLTLLATTNVETSDAGLASGLFNTSQQVGGALGLAILSTLAASRTSNLLGHGVVTSVAVRDSALTSGYHVAFAVGAAMLLAALLVLAVTIRKQDVDADRQRRSQPDPGLKPPVERKARLARPTTALVRRSSRAPATLPRVPRNRTVRLAVLGSSVQRAASSGYPSSRSSALKRRIIVGGLVLLSLVLITVSFRSSALDGVQGTAASVLRPFEVAADRVTTAVP